jgi:hypothetical protein
MITLNNGTEQTVQEYLRNQEHISRTQDYQYASEVLDLNQKNADLKKELKAVWLDTKQYYKGLEDRNLLPVKKIYKEYTGQDPLIPAEDYKNCVNDNCEKRCMDLCLNTYGCAGITVTKSGNNDQIEKCSIYPTGVSEIINNKSTSFEVFPVSKSDDIITGGIRITKNLQDVTKSLLKIKDSNMKFQTNMANMNIMNDRNEILKNNAYLLQNIENEIQLSRENARSSNKSIHYNKFLYLVISLVFLTMILYILKALGYINTYWYNMYIKIICGVILIKFSFTLSVLYLILMLFL